MTWDSKPRLALECGALFIGVPLVMALGGLLVLVIPLLLVMAAGCGLALRWRHDIRLSNLLRRKAPGREWRRIIAIYLLVIPFLMGLLWLIKPAAMFALMCRHPRIWILVMLAYPVVSVFPQELIYRAFFFERYRPLFGRDSGMIMASAGVFAFGHVIFHNWPAVFLTFLGGGLFGVTYQRTSSLLVTAAEHALYGCAVFTIGFGEFFFDGTLRWIR